MKRFIIAKEGFSLVVAVSTLAVIIMFTSNSFLFQLFSLLLVAGTVYLFRNPQIAVERYDKSEILSICDGVVANIKTLECKGRIKGECYKVTVITRLIDKGQLRAPFDATLTLLDLHRGMQLPLHIKKSTYLNEEAKIVFQSRENDNDLMVVKHRLNRFNIPLSFYTKENEKVAIGQRYGFMLHGEITIFLPSVSRLAIKIGDDLKVGETLLGYFTR